MDSIYEKDNVINKDILYTDNPLRITTLSGVDESSLEECLNIVIEANKYATFHLIQYSKQDRRIYFYADTDVYTKAWKPKKKSSKSLKTIEDVTEEIEKVFNFSKEKETTCMSIFDRDDIISLYDIGLLLQKENEKLSDIKVEYINMIEDAYRKKKDDNKVGVYFDKFDYSDKRLKLSFKKYSFTEYVEHTFCKKDGILVLESSILNDDDVLPAAGEFISEFFDKLLEFKNLNEQKSKRINPLNSSFIIDISSSGIEIYTEEYKFLYDSIFELRLFLDYKGRNNYNCKCNYNSVVSLIDNKEDELFKKIYIRISDCPEWMHRSLYEERKRQLEIENQERKQQEEQQLQQEEQKESEKQEEIPKQKVKKRFFSFFNKKGE